MRGQRAEGGPAKPRLSPLLTGRAQRRAESARNARAAVQAKRVNRCRSRALITARPVIMAGPLMQMPNGQMIVRVPPEPPPHARSARDSPSRVPRVRARVGSFSKAPAIAHRPDALSPSPPPQQPQIVLLREGTDTSQGKGQLISNINACMAVVDSIRTTLVRLPLRTTREICGGRANRPFSLFSYFPLTARPPRRPPTPIARAGSPRARQARPRRQGRHHHLQRRSDDHEGAGRTRPSQPRAPPRTTRRSRARGPPSRERARLISSSRFIGGPVPPGSEPSRDFFFLPSRRVAANGQYSSLPANSAPLTHASFSCPFPPPFSISSWTSSTPRRRASWTSPVRRTPRLATARRRW